jgi:hypothetical protein
MASYETDLNNLKTAQRNAAVANLENTRNQALSNLQAERQQNAATYNTQRSTANAQNRMSAKNFQEYLASTGRANSGLNAQARMQYNNNLNTSLNTLNAGEAAALADINRRTTDAQNAYSTGLAGANAQIEADYIKNLLSERDKELSRQLQQRAADLQERQFQESVRQFNENLALQRQQLQSRFSSGSGGGSSSRRGKGSSGTDINWTDTPKKQLTLTEQNNAARKAAKVGQKYVKSIRTAKGGIVDQLWRKTASGKDVRVR